jgi:hypothetical protein
MDEAAGEVEAEAQHPLQINNNDIIPLQPVTRHNSQRLTPAKRHASDTDFETPPNKLREPRRWNPIIQIISNQIIGVKRKIDSSYHFPNKKMKNPRWIIYQKQLLKKKKKNERIIKKMKFEAWHFNENCTLNYLNYTFNSILAQSNNLFKGLQYFRDPGG